MQFNIKGDIIQIIIKVCIVSSFLLDVTKKMKGCKSKYMRTYIDKKGNSVEVDKEHLDVAVKLKLELQNSSYGRRTSWPLHKKMMIKEGFLDSCVTDSYRGAIKNHQKSIGKLPSVVERESEVAEGTLESIKEAVGELAYERRENRHVLLKLNRVKNSLIDDSIFIKEVKSSIDTHLSSEIIVKMVKNAKKRPKIIKKASKGTKMVILATDWHIGAMVDVDGNKFNYEIAKERIAEFTQKSIDIGLGNEVTEVEVVFMGDAVEHAYMRNNQGYTVEFPLSEQIVKCGRLISEMLIELSEYFEVGYRGFAGNHDRMASGKNDSIDGDTAMVTINGLVESIIEKVSPSIRFVETHKYNAQLLDINGVNLKFVHGDFEAKANRNKVSKHSDNDNVRYSVVVLGHFHHFECVEVGVDKFEVFVASIKGSDDYSKKFGLGSGPSQAVILIDIDGNIDVRRVKINS